MITGNAGAYERGTPCETKPSTLTLPANIRLGVELNGSEKLSSLQLVTAVKGFTTQTQSFTFKTYAINLFSWSVNLYSSGALLRP